ncbi:putative Zinc finger SWIM domain-containing protein 2 [Monocercomonoides exilis]|uniref:putative Zinc finger SWIM domain-containing protein 2 n=1 Tax=Monocercomonoides exilis TaxID=2049356 RepID=UPI00355994D5|nr:putative Zinc finger SWIM domain-containing protein 2 [Monocercomonoides exilis]|eukprot:MONOS_2436.1-p1 / transcript=MONOS_2436.1 / gene=MONOS_2436 / organism=Monocercomonoides_exilis_PA203 / gene_product=Zinc finger SWIM domain-containing protein 2 / transcript_product=Zinc finger SWIM domain-containing protein 2 / location=Mono_scaffold00050:100484-105367(-) / protein_length=1627 / sequence_SO=supercontig / SO=protein_coding / is_pseudo=false
MSRETPWVNKSDESTDALLQLASHSGLLVIQNVGPLSFVIRDANGRKNKVSLGGVNICSCQKRRGDLCVHIAFVVTRVFRIPTTNPLAWQRGYIDRELTQLLKGSVISQQQEMIHHRRSSSPASHSSSSSSSSNKERPVVEQRAIGPDSICAICQEEMNIKQPLSYCRFGCGNSVHTRCLGFWAQHNKSIGNTINCPFCRAEWGPIETAAPPRSTCPFVHSRSSCSECRMSPIVGPKLRCMICSDYNLCVECYRRGAHSRHSFQCYDTNSCMPRLLSGSALGGRTRIDGLSPSEISELQQREITPEDYALLLQLDEVHTQARKFPLSLRLITLLLDASSSSEQSQSIGTCAVCHNELYPAEGETDPSKRIRSLACGHLFHAGCIDKQLLLSDLCPIDNMPAIDYASLVDVEDAVKEKIMAARKSKPHSHPSSPHLSTKDSPSSSSSSSSFSSSSAEQHIGHLKSGHLRDEHLTKMESGIPNLMLDGISIEAHHSKNGSSDMTSSSSISQLSSPTATSLSASPQPHSQSSDQLDLNLFASTPHSTHIDPFIPPPLRLPSRSRSQSRHSHQPQQLQPQKPGSLGRVARGRSLISPFRSASASREKSASPGTFSSAQRFTPVAREDVSSLVLAPFQQPDLHIGQSSGADTQTRNLSSNRYDRTRQLQNEYHATSERRPKQNPHTPPSMQTRTALLFEVMGRRLDGGAEQAAPTSQRRTPQSEQTRAALHTQRAMKMRQANPTRHSSQSGTPPSIVAERILPLLQPIVTAQAPTFTRTTDTAGGSFPSSFPSSSASMQLLQQNLMLSSPSGFALSPENSFSSGEMQTDSANITSIQLDPIADDEDHHLESGSSTSRPSSQEYHLLSAARINRSADQKPGGTLYRGHVGLSAHSSSSSSSSLNVLESDYENALADERSNYYANGGGEVNNESHSQQFQRTSSFDKSAMQPSVIIGSAKSRSRRGSDSLAAAGPFYSAANATREFTEEDRNEGFLSFDSGKASFNGDPTLQSYSEDESFPTSQFYMSEKGASDNSVLQQPLMLPPPPPLPHSPRSCPPASPILPPQPHQTPFSDYTPDSVLCSPQFESTQSSDKFAYPISNNNNTSSYHNPSMEMAPQCSTALSSTQSKPAQILSDTLACSRGCIARGPVLSCEVDDEGNLTPRRRILTMQDEAGVSQPSLRQTGRKPPSQQLIRGRFLAAAKEKKEEGEGEGEGDKECPALVLKGEVVPSKLSSESFLPSLTVAPTHSLHLDSTIPHQPPATPELEEEELSSTTQTHSLPHTDSAPFPSPSTPPSSSPRSFAVNAFSPASVSEKHQNTSSSPSNDNSDSISVSSQNQCSSSSSPSTSPSDASQTDCQVAQDSTSSPNISSLSSSHPSSPKDDSQISSSEGKDANSTSDSQLQSSPSLSPSSSPSPSPPAAAQLSKTLSHPSLRSPNKSNSSSNLRHLSNTLDDAPSARKQHNLSKTATQPTMQMASGHPLIGDKSVGLRPLIEFEGEARQDLRQRHTANRLSRSQSENVFSDLTTSIRVKGQPKIYTPSFPTSAEDYHQCTKSATNSSLAAVQSPRRFSVKQLTDTTDRADDNAATSSTSSLAFLCLSGKPLSSPNGESSAQSVVERNSDRPLPRFQKENLA